MRTPKQWEQLCRIAAPVRILRAAIEEDVRLHLKTLGVDERITTEQLVETMYPRELARKTLAGDNARASLYKYILKSTLNGLEDCCERGEINGKYMGRPRRPWLWFCPADSEICALCGQLLPVEENDINNGYAFHQAHSDSEEPADGADDSADGTY